MADHPVELVTLRLAVLAARPVPPREAGAATTGSLEAARRDTRPVWFASTGFVGTPVYARSRLPADARFAGPAIVEQMDATTVVPPGWALRVDAANNLLLERKEATVKGPAWHLEPTR
jgi:N-methylhydantoinase A